MLYADDLALMAESEVLLMEKLRKWKNGMEAKGLRVNAGKTKVMQCLVSRFQNEDSGEHPCDVCKELRATQSIVYRVSQVGSHKMQWHFRKVEE